MFNSHKIQFEKPDLPDLTENYTVVDLHFHSRHSDGFNKVDTIANRARELGIGIAITDHNAIEGAVKLDRHKEILSIPGIEVTSGEGTHVLIYFYDIESLKQFYYHDIRPHMGAELMSSIRLEMEEIIRLARRFDSVIVFPHPYAGSYAGICNPYFSGDRLNKILKMADGIEVINSENLNKWNLRSALLGFNLDHGITGGSDGHRLPQMGRVVSLADCSADRRAFLDAVKAKQTMVIGKESNILKKVTSNGIKLRTSLKNYPDLMEKNLRYGFTVINNKSKSIRDNVKRNLNEKMRVKGVGSGTWY